MKKQDEIYHLRYYDKDGKAKSHGGITVIYRRESDLTGVFSFAVCDKQYQFSRRHGRHEAYRKLSGLKWAIPLTLDNPDEHPLQAILKWDTRLEEPSMWYSNLPGITGNGPAAINAVKAFHQRFASLYPNSVAARMSKPSVEQILNSPSAVLIRQAHEAGPEALDGVDVFPKGDVTYKAKRTEVHIFHMKCHVQKTDAIAFSATVGAIVGAAKLRGIALVSELPFKQDPGKLETWLKGQIRTDQLEDTRAMLERFAQAVKASGEFLDVVELFGHMTGVEAEKESSIFLSDQWLNAVARGITRLGYEEWANGTRQHVD